MTNGTSSLSKKKGKQILLAAIIISAIVAALIVYQNSQKIEPQTIPSQLDAQIIQKALPQNDQTKKIQPGSELTTTSISLSWRSPSGLVTTDYSIQYSTDNTNWVNWSHSPSSATSQTITGLSSNTAYYFRVAAVNAGGIGAYTSSVSRTTLPESPTGLRVSGSTTTSVSLLWTAPLGSATTDYSIQYSTDNTNWVNWSHSPSSATSQTITGLSSNTAYYFRVAAVNAGGIGAYTSSVSRTTLPDTPSSFGVPIQSIPQPPEQPVTPQQPTAPEQPVTPQQPTAPEQPVTPQQPTAPEQPVTPQQPTAPQQPATPKQPTTTKQISTPTKTQQKTKSSTAEVTISFGASTDVCKMNNSCYSPSKLMISQGTIVVWYNKDSKEHTVTSGPEQGQRDGLFNSGLIRSGDNFSFKFDKTGDYQYHCMIYPWMKGKVTVQ